jgi:excisionase family DNA binding protein
VNWSSDIETIFGGANCRSQDSVIRRGRTLTPLRARVASGARQRRPCGARNLPGRADLTTSNKSPFRTVRLTLKLENDGVKAVGLVKLDEAAERLGCHVETLRVHIRDGRLRAIRGPHGAYYLDARHVATYPRPQRGWPKPRAFSARQLGQSWSLIEGTLPKAMAWPVPTTVSSSPSTARPDVQPDRSGAWHHVASCPPPHCWERIPGTPPRTSSQG